MKNIYQRAIEYFGKDNQLQMAQEEATELALAIRRHIRFNNETTLYQLADEIADVNIMIEQLCEMQEGLNLKVSEIFNHKITRLVGRMNINYNALALLYQGENVFFKGDVDDRNLKSLPTDNFFIGGISIKHFYKKTFIITLFLEDGKYEFLTEDPGYFMKHNFEIID